MINPMLRAFAAFFFSLALSAASSALAGPAVTPGATPGQYHYLREIPIGGEGGWDYLATDSDTRRLYVTHGTEVEVVNLDTHQIVGKILDTPGVHGVAIARDLGRGFTSNGKENKVSIFDLATLKTLAKVPTGTKPDAIVYEPGRKEVYAFNGGGNSVTVIDAAMGKVSATIALPGAPEFAAVSPEFHRVFVAIEDRDLVVSIDSKTHQIIASWPTAPGKEPSALAIDPLTHRLFVGCGNEQMLMMDSVGGAIASVVPIGKKVDAIVFDPHTLLVASANGEGTATLAYEKSADELKVLQTLETRKGAHTLALDSKTHDLYFMVADYLKTPQSAVKNASSAARPKIISGSQKLLVFGP